MSVRSGDLLALQRNAGAAVSMLRALANERRLMILSLLLADEELTVDNLAEELPDGSARP